MQKNIFLILCLATGLGIFTSCQKSSSSKSTPTGPTAPTGSFSLTDTVNGTPTNLSTIIFAKKLDTLGFYTLSVTGLSSLSTTGNTLLLTFASVVPISTGTFKSNSLASGIVGINVLNGDTYSSLNDSSINTLSGTITALTDTYVTGSFSGIVTDSLKNTDTISGSFYAPVE
jgi:hypothetical protein